MIRNTHYNLIDTLIFAFGLERWNAICRMVMPAIRERLGKDSILIPLNGRYYQYMHVSDRAMLHVINELHDIVKANDPNSEFLQFSQAIRWTILDCVLWTMTEGYMSKGRYYGLPREETV